MSPEDKAFLEFLTKELERHDHERMECIEEMSVAHAKIPFDPDYYEALYDFWNSAKLRHERDIRDTTKKINRVKEIFGI